MELDSELHSSMNLTPLSSSRSLSHFLPKFSFNNYSRHDYSFSISISSSRSCCLSFKQSRAAILLPSSDWGFKTERRRGGRRESRLMASRRESPYDVLGVSPSATPQEIKRAYRKLALKYHPDVNKEANAQENFMRIKHAYNTLLNSESQSKYDFSNGRSNYSRTSSERNRNRTAQEEDFYGFGNLLKDVQIAIADLFRDLQTEFENWEADINSQDKPKSLWEELAVIGEEFVEFLEKELNINEVEGDSDGSFEGNSSTKSGEEKSGKGAQDEVNKTSSIDDSIDDIEAALAQLKKELGL